ncbi:MAG: EamA family transporter [Duodenibacillus sp.]|nr:EamA family transporter [Duodenibacillus sp.]
MNKRFALGFSLVALAGVLWGAMGVAAQHLMQGRGIGAFELVAARQLASGALLVAVLALADRRSLMRVFASRADALGTAVCGLLMLGAHFGFFKAVAYSNAGTGAIFLTLIPLMGGAWLALRRGEPMRPVEILCFALSAAGVALIMTGGDFTRLKFSPAAVAWGLWCAALSTAYAIYPVELVKRAGVAPVLGWATLLGGLVGCCIARPWTVGLVPTPADAAAFGFIVVFGTVIAFWCYLTGLKDVSPVVAGLVISLEPLSAYAFGVLLLGLRLAAWECAGIALVIASVTLIALARERPQATA